MSAIDINRSIFLKGLNRLRAQLFGDESLKIFGIVPETGETLLAELFENWSGREVESATDSNADSSSWQFQIAANDDWQTSQNFLSGGVSFRIGTRRWKILKVKKPIGNSKVWRLKAEIQ